MKRTMISAGFACMILAVLAVSGCTFVLKDGDTMRYYGANEQQDKEYLDRVIAREESAYQSQKVSEPQKAPARVK